MTQPEKPDDIQQWRDAYSQLSLEVRAIRNSIRFKIYSSFLSGVATGLALAFVSWAIAEITR